ncbi:MAG TPA: glycosyltransferase [Acidimicrobiia bacterium]|jgi:glycosyltransferase involved in cell wall biosynthesis
MKIWIVTTSYPRQPGESINAGVVVRDLALDFAQRGHEVSVFTPAKPGLTRFDPEVRGVLIPWLRPSIALADLNVSNPMDATRAASLMLRGSRLVRREAQHRPPDGIVAVWGLPSGMFARTAAAVSGAPYCVWLLGSDVWRASRFPAGVTMLRRVIRDSRATFANSHDLAHRAMRITGQRVGYLPAIRRLPDGAGSGPNTDLVYVGRLHPNKGVDVLIEAMGLLRRSGLTPRTLIYGSGALQQSLQHRIDALTLGGTVHLRGPIEAGPLADQLRASRFLVLPSRVDSTPLVLGDAIQARLPVVATDVGDTGGLVRRFRLGEVVAADNPQALSDGIRRALSGAASAPFGWPDWEGAAQLMTPHLAFQRFSEALALG